jgi:hypothetical protein
VTVLGWPLVPRTDVAAAPGIPGRGELAVPVAEQELDAVGALAGRAIVLISDLGHIYEGSPGHPFGPYIGEIPPRTERPAPEPAGQDTAHDCGR